MPNLKIFLTVVFCVAILVTGLEYLPKFYAQPITQTINAKPSLESAEKMEEKMLKDKEESKRTHMGYSIVGYFLLLSLLLYIKILIQRPKRLE